MTAADLIRLLQARPDAEVRAGFQGQHFVIQDVDDQCSYLLLQAEVSEHPFPLKGGKPRTERPERLKKQQRLPLDEVNAELLSASRGKP